MKETVSIVIKIFLRVLAGVLLTAASLAAVCFLLIKFSNYSVKNRVADQNPSPCKFCLKCH